MKFLKILLWIVLALAAIFLILCATGSKDMNVSKSLTMKAPAENIYSLVTDFNTMKDWSPWNQRDPNMKTTVTGTPGAVGHSNEWVSESEGSGKQWLVEVEPNHKATTALTFKDWPDTSYSSFTFEPSGDSTKVTWSMEGGEVPFIFRGVMTLMGGKKSLEKDFSNGLANLAKVAEAMPTAPSVAYDVIDIPDTWYVGKMHKGLEVKNITSDMYATGYAEIGKYLGSMKTTMAGPPMSIAHNFSEETMTMDMELAVPVATEIPATDKLTSGKIPAGKAAQYTYMGSYSDMSDTWMKFMGAVMAHHKPRWDSYEVYVTDPGEEPDTSKWVTHLVVPIEE